MGRIDNISPHQFPPCQHCGRIAVMDGTKYCHTCTSAMGAEAKPKVRPQRAGTRTKQRGFVLHRLQRILSPLSDDLPVALALIAVLMIAFAAALACLGLGLRVFFWGLGV